MTSPSLSPSLAAYSPRPDPEASISTPVSWNELGKIYPTDFTIVTLPDRLKQTGDLWEDILDAKSDLKMILSEKESGKPKGLPLSKP
ncbi:MAG: hypothetical protein ABIH70_08865 [Chloroflexota bacterium]